MLSAGILLCACPDRRVGNRYITLINKSERSIRYSEIVGWDSNQFYCPPTGNILMPSRISSDSSYTFECPYRDYGWEETLSKSSLQIIIVDENAYKLSPSNACDTIQKYVPILYCYQLKLEDLQRMNWTVVYPPEE